jgi:hypothetical protein
MKIDHLDQKLLETKRRIYIIIPEYEGCVYLFQRIVLYVYCFESKPFFVLQAHETRGVSLRFKVLFK